MSPHVSSQINLAQALARLAFWCAWRARWAGDHERVIYWQGKQRQHAARARSMLFDWIGESQ